MRKIRFINVSSSSGQAMRACADNPIAIHHQAGRYTTIASLSLIIFFFFAPLRFFVFAFQNRVCHGCLPSSHPAAPSWMASGRREANWLLSSIKCHRRGQTLSAKSWRFVGVLLVEICRRRESDAPETRGIKKLLRKKSSIKEAGVETSLSFSLPPSPPAPSLWNLSSYIPPIDFLIKHFSIKIKLNYYW